MTSFRAVLRVLEYLAYPAFAGVAWWLLALGVVTWLPALAAMAHALQRWRVDGEARCFTGTFAAFPRYWRRLWRHSLVSTAAFGVLGANLVFLADRPHPAAYALLAAQLGIVIALVPYHVGVAVTAARAPEAALADWRRGALVLAFGSAPRGLALLGAAIVTPVVTLPVPFGPLLFGPSLPVLLGLVLAESRDPDRPSHPPTEEAV